MAPRPSIWASTRPPYGACTTSTPYAFTDPSAVLPSVASHRTTPPAIVSGAGWPFGGQTRLAECEDISLSKKVHDTPAYVPSLSALERGLAQRRASPTCKPQS